MDAARQMLDELMGRNRNLHPSEAVRKVKWDDPDFCQYYLVKFCPHDLFVNTRADLGPCTRIHDDEARELYEQAQPTQRKRQYEDEFLRFCNTMLNDVDRKIQKGKQRLLLMQRDQPMSAAQLHLSKYNEQLNNLNARIKKLLTEAEEAGIRGDVDQAQDLMTLCEQLKDEKEALVAQHENSNAVVVKDVSVPPPPIIAGTVTNVATTNNIEPLAQNSPNSNGEAASSSDTVATTDGVGSGGAVGDKKVPAWMQDLGTLPEKQMEVCEVCGAFLIVGDAQQRIEDHLMGKQHLGYSRLRKAVEELHEKRQKEREEDERKRQEDREEHRSHRATSFSERNHFNDRRRDYQRDRYDYNRERGGGRDYGGRSREYGNHHTVDRHRHHHHKSSHRRRSHSRSHSHRSDHRDHSSRSHSRTRSRSRSHSHGRNRY